MEFTRLQVGEQRAADGSIIMPRGSRQGDTICSNLHGRFTEQALNGNVYMGANQAAVATTAGLATTWTGLSLTNPSTSTVNIAILKFGWGQLIAQPTAATVLGLMTSDTTGLASAVTGYNGFNGVGATSNAVLDNGGTIATPVLQMIVGYVGTGALTVQMATKGEADIEGAIILPPGRSVLTYTQAASAASQWMFSFVWEEIPI